MKYSLSFCDPLHPDNIEMGDFDEEQIMEIFLKIPWSDYWVEVQQKDEPDIHYAPSLEIENKEFNFGLEISSLNKKEWSVYFQRQKTASFPQEQNEIIEATGLTKKKVISILNALISNQLDSLEKMIRKA